MPTSSFILCLRPLYYLFLIHLLDDNIAQQDDENTEFNIDLERNQDIIQDNIDKLMHYQEYTNIHGSPHFKYEEDSDSSE